MSPLRRARQTAAHIWPLAAGGRPDPAAPGDALQGAGGAVVTLDSLREIDLYAFQGLLKAEGEERYGTQYSKWKKEAENFEIDGHFPVRELWARAAAAWDEILADARGRGARSVLVVAHNAVIQALVADALKLDECYFRRLLQSNCGVTVVDFVGGSSGGVRVDRLNQTPAPPIARVASGAGRKALGRVVLCQHAATTLSQCGRGDAGGVLLGALDARLSEAGRAQAQALGAALADVGVAKVLMSPRMAARETAAAIAVEAVQGGKVELAEAPSLFFDMAHAGNGDVVGGAHGPANPVDFALASLGSIDKPAQLSAPASPQLWEAAGEAYHELRAAAAAAGESVVVAVTHPALTVALTCRALGLPPAAATAMRVDAGSMTVLDFPDGVECTPVLRAHNYTAHLGSWAVPVTRVEEVADAASELENAY